MEAIRISCAGYPTRKAFAEFVDRFGLLAPEVLDGRYVDIFCSLFLAVSFFRTIEGPNFSSSAYFIMVVLMRSKLVKDFWRRWA